MEMESPSLSKEEFIQWKESQVTKAVFNTIKGRISEAKEILAYKTESDPDGDQLLRGMIRAWDDILDISFEE